MGAKLYRQPNVAVREPLQNSSDTCFLGNNWNLSGAMAIAH